MTRSSNGRLIRIGILLILPIALLAGCSGGDSSSVTTVAGSATTSAPSGGGEEAPSDEGALDDGGAVQDGDGGETAEDGSIIFASQPRDVGRVIIYRAAVTIATSDVAAAGLEAVRIIESVDGFLFGQETTGGAEAESILTFKVDPERFQETLARLGSLGEVRNQTVTADDVTERIVDLESRISTAETSVERLRALLADAQGIEAVARIESELLARETTLETLRGELRTVRDQVALATIVVRLTQALSNPSIRLEITAYPGGGDDGESCPGNGAITVDEGEEATLCFEVVNRGDTPLGGFELRDTALDVELGDLVPVFGDPDDPLEPGQSFVVAHQVTVERTMRSQTRVSATPLDEDGQPLEGRDVANTQSITVDAVDPGGLPGFGEGISAGWTVLASIVGLAIVIVAWVIPFVWVVPLAWLILRLARRGREGGGTSGDDAVATPQPSDGGDPATVTAPPA
ncbi:MAG TPA: DUF4349 domain-containing protein [Acidimicrobiia bacterium]